MTASIKANVDGSAAIQVGGVDAITLTSAGAATFLTSPTTVQAGTAAAPSITFSGDTNTGIYSPGADTIAFTEGGVESARFDSSGNFLINATTNSLGARVRIATATRTANFFDLTATGGENWVINSTNTTGSTDVLGIYANGATGWYLQDNGNVGIGTTSPSTFGQLAVYGNGTAPVIANFLGSNSPATNATYGDIAFGSRTDGTVTARIRGFANDNGNGTDGQLSFWTADNTAGAGALTERARITSGGDLLVGKTSVDNNPGIALRSTGEGYFVRSGADVLSINRLSSDGILINFYQDTVSEGNISVSGTTVSYNGGHLARWAQMLTKPELLKGTVMSNLDEMNVYTDADGNPVENEQLNKVKVSDVEGDVNVAGVFVNWSYDEQHQVDEINMAMTGDMIIRIAQGVTVQKGDLLMSAGDGTAKPQGDDIVRSKTVAKVTSNHVTCTYEDGSYCVPCVLMAC